MLLSTHSHRSQHSALTHVILHSLWSTVHLQMESLNATLYTQSQVTAQCTDPCHSAFIVVNGPSLDGVIKSYSLHTVILKVAFRCGHAKSHVTAQWTDPCRSSFIVVNEELPSIDGVIKGYSLHSHRSQYSALTHVVLRSLWSMKNCRPLGAVPIAHPAGSGSSSSSTVSCCTHTYTHIIQNINTVLCTPFFANFQSYFVTHTHTHG